MLYYALCLSYYSNTEAVLFACLSSGWANTTGRLLGPKVGNSIKCLSQGHSDALPHRESNQSGNVDITSLRHVMGKLHNTALNLTNEWGNFLQLFLQFQAAF